MRRERGSIRERGGKLYAQFVNPATGLDTMRLLRGVTPKSTQKAQEAALRLCLADADAESVESVAQAEPLRWKDWLRDEYLSVLAAAVEPSTMRSIGVHADRLADWLVTQGDPTMDLVTRPAAERFVGHLHAEGLQPSYVARLTRTLRVAWRAAIARGLAAENPWEGLKLRRPRDTDIAWIEPAKLSRLLRRVNAWQRPVATLIADTGLRPGEALALRVRDADELAVHVRHGKTRAARRAVPLTVRAREAIRPFLSREPDEPLFDPRSVYGLSEAIAAAAKRVKVPRATSKTLRHWYASHLVRAGTPPPTVARLLGHSDGGVLVLRLYGRWMPRDAEEMAVARLESFRATPARPRG